MTRMAGHKGITNFLGTKPQYGNIGGQSINDAADDFRTVVFGNAQLRNAGLKAQADIASAQHYADVQPAIGAAQGQALLVSGITSGVDGFSRFMPKGGLFNKDKVGGRADELLRRSQQPYTEI